MSSQAGLFAAACAAVILLVACGAPGDDAAERSRPPPRPTIPVIAAERLGSAELTYLREFDAAVASLGDLGTLSVDALGAPFPDRNQLIPALRDAGYARYGTSIEGIEALDPPERFRADHARFTAFLGDFRPVAAAIQRALDDENLATAALGAVQFRLRHARAALEFESPSFCLHAFGPALGVPPEIWRAVCTAPESLPGGTYGRAVFEHLTTFGVAFGLRVSGVLNTMTPDELFAYLTAVQPDVERAVAAAADALRKLTPPSEFGPDHAAMLQFLDEIGAATGAITAASNERDVDAVLDGFGESRDALVRAQTNISDAYRPIAAPYFGAGPG
jgi:hypothetical protein